MESWLDENQDFFQEYLLRKGTRPMIDAWLVAHSFPPGGAQAPSPGQAHAPVPGPAPRDLVSEDREDNMEAALSPSVSSSRSISTGSSGTQTPVRKISAHEFERGGLVKPLVTTIDG